MDFKKQIKNLANSTLGGGIQIHIDYVFSQDAILVVSGWCALPEDSENQSINLKNRNEDVPSEVVTFERSDVEASFSKDSNKMAFGFVIGTKLQASLLDLTIECGLCSIALAQFSDKQLSSIEPMQADAGDSAEDVLDMLENLGLMVEADEPEDVEDPDIDFVRETVALLDPTSTDFVETCFDEVLPVLHKRWRRRLQKENKVQTLVLGTIPESPTVSLVIPIYGRYDFIQHQISAFAKDEDFVNYEIIYVIDDPRIRHEVNVTAHGVYEVFGFPFKVVFSAINLGFAGANNLGVSFARSDTLLLLNSDVLPARAGWLAQMRQDFNDTENCGMLSALLLYEDDTVQHAGMTFQKDPSIPNIWMNYHPQKGFPVHLVKKQGVHPVDAVTGACVMMRKALFEEVEGFDSLYILGDFEDSDLCLKVIDKGYQLAVTHNVSLYHLERLSQNMMSKDMWKQKLTFINGAYQVKRWQGYLEEFFG